VAHAACQCFVLVCSLGSNRQYTEPFQLVLLIVVMSPSCARMPTGSLQVVCLCFLAISIKCPQVTQWTPRVHVLWIWVTLASSHGEDLLTRGPSIPSVTRHGYNPRGLMQPVSLAGRGTVGYPPKNPRRRRKCEPKGTQKWYRYIVESIQTQQLQQLQQRQQNIITGTEGYAEDLWMPRTTLGRI
jgi:hypothetical protein